MSRDSGPPVRRTRINHMIRITPIRLIGADNEPIGVVETSEALRMADSQGLDLVEISPDARPPVCKIMDYGRFKYEQSKEEKDRTKNKPAELKEVRLGRSIKIDPHDVGIRIDQTRRFLMEGHKVRIVQVFRGREMQHRDLGMRILQDFVHALADISKVESPPRTQMKRTELLLAPDKVKIEAIKRKQDKERGVTSPAPSAAPAPASAPAAAPRPASAPASQPQPAESPAPTPEVQPPRPVPVAQPSPDPVPAPPSAPAPARSPARTGPLTPAPATIGGPRVVRPA